MRPPGGSFKYALSHWLARRQERTVVLNAAEIISVSHEYNNRLHARYSQLRAAQFHELPFGGSEADFATLGRLKQTQPYFDPADGRAHWVYVGRGGDDMHFSVGAFFTALRRALDARLLKPEELRVHFIGTSYAPEYLAGRSFEGLIRIFGLQEIVTEHPDRISYFTALRCLRDAHALLVPGSDQSGYTASKILPCLLARRPLLALFHEKSDVVKILQDTHGGVVSLFDPAKPRDELAERIFHDWFLARAFDQFTVPDEEALIRHDAAAMTRRLTEIFDAAISQPVTSR